jgi:manganese oxidase
MKSLSSFTAVLVASLIFTPIASAQDHSHHNMDHSQMQHGSSPSPAPKSSTSSGRATRSAVRSASRQQANRAKPDKGAPPKKDVASAAPRLPVPVVTPDIAHLPWTMENGVKVFHLTAEVVKREIMPKTGMAPAKVITVWGYNGSVPGPTIEVNEGDHVRIIFHNNLPEETTVHWHGLEIPIAMDGMPFISQPPVKPGGMFTYEFKLHQNGTFFYHSHGAMQEMMGAIGMFIIHPKKQHNPPVNKDFAWVLQEFAVLQNNDVPNSMAMEFNWLTMNGKAAPATTPVIVRQGDRVRMRFVNIGMDHHPIHLHGNQFYVTGTEGGRVPQSAWFPGNTVIVGVAQSRDVEFDAIYPGDWMVHCHLPHHMMNNMVSMVGPMSHVGHGMQTGGGMEEGMGIVRQGHALSDEMGPQMGRGMGNTVDAEQAQSHSIGHTPRARNIATPLGQDPNSQRGPGYPQDELMMMQVDAAVAKPQNNYLAPGWSAMMQGMMTLVRVMPPAQYDRLMADIKAGRIDPAQLRAPGHTAPGTMHHGQTDEHTQHTDHGQMNHGSEQQMDHSQMNHGSEQQMDHSQMNHGSEQQMDHSQMQH